MPYCTLRVSLLEKLESYISVLATSKFSLFLFLFLIFFHKKAGASKQSIDREANKLPLSSYVHACRYLLPLPAFCTLTNNEMTVCAMAAHEQHKTPATDSCNSQNNLTTNHSGISSGRHDFACQTFHGKAATLRSYLPGRFDFGPAATLLILPYGRGDLKVLYSLHYCYYRVALHGVRGRSFPCSSPLLFDNLCRAHIFHCNARK